jgi:transketolase
MEYARNAVRMAALMGQRCIFVYTHDSIGLGEDGPDAPARGAAHGPARHAQPAHLAALRCRGDGGSLEGGDRAGRAGPYGARVSRARVCRTRRAAMEQVAAIQRGAYVLRDCEGAPELILHRHGIGGGAGHGRRRAPRRARAACALCPCPAARSLRPRTRLTARPCCPATVLARVAIEAGHPDFWYKYVGLDGRIVGIDRFGESAPARGSLRSLRISPWTTCSRTPARCSRPPDPWSASPSTASGASGAPCCAPCRKARTARRCRWSRSTSWRTPRPWPT